MSIMKLLALSAAVVYTLHILTQPPQQAKPIQLTPQTILEVHNVITKPVQYRGKSALESATPIRSILTAPNVSS